MNNTGAEIHVLHVDDGPDFADVAGTFLEREDDRITVATVTSASEGLERLAETDFDCVVSDYDMPGRNGIEFLETVRKDHPELPFILFTGKGSEEVASEAISAGVTDYLQKEGGTDQYTILANRIQNTVEQYRATQRAAELDRIRTLASAVNQALVRAESRVEAETRICEIFSDSDPYLFAWIGEIDRETDRVEPRASAGIEEGYLDDITITTDEAETGQGPGGTAIRERRIAISQNIAEDPEFEPWRENALERGYQSVAAVPLEHAGTLYGELVVYAERPDAFDDTERNLLAELGNNIAYSFHSFDVRARLRKERDQRQALFENAPGPVIAADFHDEDDTILITDINDAFEDVFGYDTEEAVGKDPAEFVVPEDDTNRYQEFRQRAIAGEMFVAEVERLTADGRRTFLLHVIPYGLDDSSADGLYAWFTDISDRSEREQTIRELHHATNGLMRSKSRKEVAEIATGAVRDILDMSANGVHLYDEAEGGLVPVAWTEQTEEIVGEPPTFALGEGLAGTAFETGEPQIYDDISTVPERFNPDTEVRSQIIFPLDSHGVLVIGSPEPDAFSDADVSLAEIIATHTTTALDRLKHEEELQRAQVRYRALIENFPNGGVFLYDENLTCLLAGGEGLSEVGVTSDEIEGERPRNRYPKEVAEKIEAHLQQAFEGKRTEFKQTYGGKHYRIRALPIGDEPIRHVMAVSQDVTSRKEHERAIERQNERLEKFASVVSHDLRNPLNVAEGQLVLAREECDSEHLDVAADAVNRCLTLINDLLTLAREGEVVSEFETVDLTETIEGCWQSVETRNATLVTETDRTIRADASRLKQLLENLIRNAVEHGGHDVTVTIGNLDDGFYVADDGPGIPEEEREQIFDPGYSTADEGTGFGLNIAYEIAEAHDWNIRVTESKNGGARFEITGVESA